MEREDNPNALNSSYSLMTRRHFLGRAALAALSATIAALSATVLSGCHNLTKEGHAGSPNGGSAGTRSSGTATVSVFDISASTHTDIVEARYLDGFEQIVAAVQGGDLLAGFPITSVTRTTSMNRFTERFPVSRGLLDNSDAYKANFARIQRDAVSRAQSILKMPTAGATDILNAFQDAAGILKGCKGMVHQLVVFSDMLHQSGRYDFARENLTPNRTKAIIQSQRHAGLLPNLSGVTVWVAGASADPTNPAVSQGGSQPFLLDPNKIEQIQNFWIAFFDACGASLTADRYSSTLQNYPA